MCTYAYPVVSGKLRHRGSLAFWVATVQGDAGGRHRLPQSDDKHEEHDEHDEYDDDDVNDGSGDDDAKYDEGGGGGGGNVVDADADADDDADAD
eukprot:5594005-Pyramimonas_sp.AAC.1